MNVEKKNQLVERIKTLEGLTGEERSNLLDLLRTSYGLVWEDRPEEVEEHLREAMPVLIEDKDKALTDGGPDAPNHVLIEGDNLEALTTLAYAHAGKIDVIYIDPPYNTGNKDFIYNDSFVDSEDGYRHSKWLSFMAKRLRIARKLLSDKGAIFISIDDNEQANLKLLCDEVFGADHFVCNFIWKSRQNKDNRNITGVSIDHEYIFCYQKTVGCRAFIGAERKTDGYQNPDNDPRGPWTSANMAGLATESARPNLHYDLIDPHTGINYGRPQKGWRYDRNTMAKLIAENRIIWPDKPTGRPRKKSFLSEISEVLPGFSSIVGVDVYTRNATVEQNEIFNETRFDFPKPVRLIKELLKQTSSKDSFILDFFAGSGTTLHAVMHLNAEDGGHRQCILVTNNENGICENVTYERNKRVIEGYTKPNGDRVEGLRTNNLRYYRIDFVPRTQSPHDLRHLVELSTDMLCIKEDLYNPAEIDCNGKKIAKRYARRFQKGDHEMIIIYEPKVIPFIVGHIKARDVKHEIKVYVNAPGRYAFDDDFSEVIDKITLCAIPDAILQAYRDVLPKAKDQELPPVNIDEDEIKKALEADSDYSYTDKKGGNL